MIVLRPSPFENLQAFLEMAATISDEESKQLGKELSNQHPSTVIGMAKTCTEIKPGFKITSARIKAVRNTGCDIYVSTCRGDMCEITNSFFKFQSPVTNADDFRRSIPQLHSQVCAPHTTWLITKPIAFLIWVTCSVLAYGSYLGNDGIVVALSSAPRLESGISAVFGNTTTFAYLVFGSFCFAVIAHAVEASIAIYYCWTVLNLGIPSTALWGLLIFLVGFPIFRELEELLVVHNNAKKSH